MTRQKRSRKTSTPSLDEEDALLPRSVDGSFPRKFGRLAADSKMVDAGSADFDIPVGTLFDPLRQIIADYPFLKHDATGKSRDLGPYERPASTATGINSINNDTISTPSLWYSISGQKMSKPVRGINIYNGKKHVVK